MDKFKKLANERRCLNMFIHELDIETFQDIDMPDEKSGGDNYTIELPDLKKFNEIFYIPLITHFLYSINTIIMIERTEHIFPELYPKLVDFYMRNVKFDRNVFYDILDRIETYIKDLLREEILTFVLQQNPDDHFNFNDTMKYLRQISKFSKACLVLQI